MALLVGLIVLAIVWTVLFVYLFRVLATLVEGMRSINATTLRIAATLDSLAEERTGAQQ